MIRLAILVLAATATPVAAPVFAQDTPETKTLEARAIGEILAVGAPPVIDIDAALGADAVAALRRLYAARDDRPIWVTTPEAPDAHDLLDRLRQPDLTIGDNLEPLLNEVRQRIVSAGVNARASTDLLLTALYGATARALRPQDAPSGFAAALDELAGATDVAALVRSPEPPQPEEPQAETPPTETPRAETPAAETPTAETPPVETTTAATPAPAAPPEPAPRARLRAAIAALQAQADQDWPSVPEGPKLLFGDSGPRVEALGRRLIASGDLEAGTPAAEFNRPLKSALEHFQARHGLPQDGVAGAATIAALNVPLKDRLAQLELNLRRLEQQGRDWGDRYLAINIPAATYRLVEGGRTIAQGPAILGAPATPTPAGDAIVDRVTLRPSYRIPQSVADRQLWPRQEADALYFINHGIRVTDDGLRQAPGAGNPLGVAKLLLAGNDRIAIHGAPNGAQSQGAFEEPERHTSLGCVMLPDIAALVRPLLAADPAWPQSRIDGTLAVGSTQVIALAQPLPVHFVYDTAWVDEDGTLEFRNDLYRWDPAIPLDPNPVPDPCGS